MTMRPMLPMAVLLCALAAAAAADPRESLRLAIEDLAATYPQQYTRAPEFRQRLAAASNSANDGGPPGVDSIAEPSFFRRWCAAIMSVNPAGACR